MRAILLSIEPWDQVWRRNQQLASRIAGTVFLEPPRPGVWARERTESGVRVISLGRPVPSRMPAGRRINAGYLAQRLRARLDGAGWVTWATHPYQLELVEALGHPMVYDRTDDWPAMESDPEAARRVQELEPAMVERAATVVVVSEGMRRQVAKPVTVVSNGVDLALFRPPEVAKEAGRFTIGFAGTLDPFRLDLGMLRELSRDPRVELLLIGPGDVPVDARKVGSHPPAEVGALLASCDALVAPYRLDCEANRTAASLKLWEYFATGLPVIATPTAGFEAYPDLVIHWPLVDDLLQACKEQARRAPQRLALASEHGWDTIAEIMTETLRRACAAG